MEPNQTPKVNPTGGSREEKLARLRELKDRVSKVEPIPAVHQPKIEESVEPLKSSADDFTQEKEKNQDQVETVGNQGETKSPTGKPLTVVGPDPHLQGNSGGSAWERALRQFEANQASFQREQEEHREEDHQEEWRQAMRRIGRI